MLFFMNHMFVSPMATAKWHRQRDLKAKIKLFTSLFLFTVFSGVKVSTLIELVGPADPEDASGQAALVNVLLWGLAINCGLDTLLFTVYLGLRYAKVKSEWLW
mmetsp:Transcript_96715/g.167871  ORF Transcript_96715/g.167871 Transcript_96715/m.167871 type:complete len:103 (+) Transcript_96715:36-344(+)